MSISTHVGMNTYHRLLVEARAEGKPIGPKHHVFDRQLREFVAREGNTPRNIEATKTVQQERKAKLTVELETVKEAKRELTDQSKRLKARINQGKTQTDQETNLRERHNQLARQKIADSYKIERDGREHKSVGNGL